MYAMMLVALLGCPDEPVRIYEEPALEVHEISTTGISTYAYGRENVERELRKERIGILRGNVRRVTRLGSASQMGLFLVFLSPNQSSAAIEWSIKELYLSPVLGIFRS